LTAVIGAASVTGFPRAIGVPVKIASTVAVAAVLAATAATAANAQTIDLSRMKCKNFIELPKETITSLTIWLDGYLTDDEEPRVVDLTQMKLKAEKLSLFCAQNPNVALLSAAEDVIEK
jgi:HdeA/HdeB family